MQETLYVEYVSFTESKKDKDEKVLLDGCVGEVDKGSFIRAARKFKEGQASGKKNPMVYVPVRFFLNLPGTLVGFYPNWGFSKNDVSEQGVQVLFNRLRVTDRVPASAYDRKIINSSQPAVNVKDVFESQVYYCTASIAKFNYAVEMLSSALPNAWLWCKESTRSAGVGARGPVFLEGRIYGADTLIQLYSKKFQGVVLQVLSRDICKGYSERMTSDLYLLSNTEEYIEHIDGVKIKRTRIGVLDLLSEITSFYTPKEYMIKKKTKKDNTVNPLAAQFAPLAKERK